MAVTGDINNFIIIDAPEFPEGMADIPYVTTTGTDCTMLGNDDVNVVQSPATTSVTHTLPYMEEDNDNNEMMMTLTFSQEGGADPVFVLQPPFLSETIVAVPQFRQCQDTGAITMPMPSPGIATNEPGPSQLGDSDPVENIYYGDELINSTGHKNLSLIHI